MGRRSLVVQESGAGEDSGTGAHRGDTAGQPPEASDVGQEMIVGHGVDVADTAADHEGVDGAANSLERDLGIHDQPGAGVDGVSAR